MILTFPDTYSYSTSQPSNDEDTDSTVYTIGVLNDGRTVLKVGVDFTAVSITMNSSAVAQMIKLLAATIDQDYDVEVTFKNDQYTPESN
jgi:hypothetical protein